MSELSSGIRAERHGTVWVAYVPGGKIGVYIDESGAPSRLMTRDEVSALGYFAEEFLARCSFREPGLPDG